MRAAQRSTLSVDSPPETQPPPLDLTGPTRTAEGKWAIEWRSTGQTAVFINRQQALAFKICVRRPTLLQPLTEITNDNPHLWTVAGTALALIDRARIKHERVERYVRIQDGPDDQRVNLRNGTCSCRMRAPSITGKQGQSVRACPHVVATMLLFKEAEAKERADEQRHR